MAAGSFLGIDLGTSAVKALLVDAEGRTVGQGSAEHPMIHPRPGYSEQHPDDWWAATTRAVRQAVADAGPAEVLAVGLSGQMHGTVLLGDDGPLCPAIIWADTRSGSEAQALTDEIGKERLIGLTGSPIAAGFQAATIRWLQKHAPTLWQQVHRIVLPKDFLRWKLTGEFTTDPSDASGSLMLDVHTRDWSDPLLSALSIERAYLPPVRPSTAVAGTLQRAAAAALELAVGIPVVTGGGDAPCAALGSGIVDGASMLLTVSTGTQVFRPLTEPLIDTEGRIHTFCSVLEPGDNQPGWYQMGATMAAGLAMRWLRDAIFELPAETGYEQMTTAAAQVAPGSDGLVFLPYLVGERTPIMDPIARGMFLGLTASHRRGHLVRTVMEGVTLALYDAFDVLRRLGATPAHIVLAGGGARSDLWRQIVADVFGQPIVPLRTVDQSAVGAALLAAAGTGRVDIISASRSWPDYGDPVDPRWPIHRRYQDLLPIYRNAYVKHREDFQHLAALTE